MTKILKDCDLEKNNIKRHDYKTQTLINIDKKFKKKHKILNGLILMIFMNWKKN